MKNKRNKLIKLFTTRILFFGVSLLLLNCQKENLIEDPLIVNQTSKIFKNQFKPDDFRKILKYQYSVDWSNPQKKYSEQLNSNFYEFPIVYSNSFNPDVFNKQVKRPFKEKYKVVVIENKDNQFDFFIAKYSIRNTENIPYKALSILKNFGYDGTLNLYDKNAEMTFAKHILKEKGLEDFYLKNKNLKQRSSETICTTTTIHHYKDWYWVVFDGYGNIISSTYQYTTFEGTSQEKKCHQKWIPDPVRPNKPKCEYEMVDGMCPSKFDKIEPVLICQEGFEDDGFGNCVKIKQPILDDRIEKLEGDLGLDEFVFSDTLELTNEQQNWINDLKNKEAKDAITDYLNSFSFTPEFENVKIFTKQTINILSNTSLTETQKYEQFKNAYDIYDPLLPQTATANDYEAKIRRYIDYFKRRGNHEFANYLESLLPLDTSFSNEDFAKLYETIREQKLNYFYALLQEIGLATFDAFKPVIEMALWEVGGTVALKALSKLPVKYLTTPIRNVISRLKAPTSTAFSNLKHAKKYGIQSYKKLGETFKELGISLSKKGVERHHLIEKRFAQNPKIAQKLFEKFGKTTDDWLCIILDKGRKGSEHWKFSQEWIKAIGKDGGPVGWTGKTTSTATIKHIEEAARKIYRDYPEILKALGL